MSQSVQDNKQLNNNEEPNLKGTLISVLILGTLIVVSWFGVYALFMLR
ncbi:MAG TPA: cytochrome c oxidase subunit 2A [Bacillota bacterium]|nr:cytochrome c oxidase subunit 2A [Bacillota bacterium]